MHAIIAAAIMSAATAQPMDIVVKICVSLPAHEQSRPIAIVGATSYTYLTLKDTKLRLHVFSPKDDGPHAAAVFLSSGGWSWDHVDQFVPHARYLAKRGMVAVVVDYRVLCRDHASPFDSLDDSQDAIRWIRQHSDVLGVDPYRIAVVGEAEGAHLAVMAALMDQDGERVSPKPDALVLYSPVLDLEKPPTRALIEQRFGAMVARYLANISPMEFTDRHLPATLIFNAREDGTAETFCKKVGKACRLVRYDGTASLHSMDRFFIDLGYLSK
jgi:acetyl esterase/lipase